MYNNNMYHSAPRRPICHRPNNNKKRNIIIGSIIAVIAIVMIFYFMSPLYTIQKFSTAATSKNYDKMIDCFEPNKAKELHRLQSLLSELPIETIIASVSGGASDGSALSGTDFSETSLKVTHFSISYTKKVSDVTVKITQRDAPDKPKEFTINFVLVGHSWYIDSISDIRI